MRSYNVLQPDESILLGPFASINEPGQGHNIAKSAVRALNVMELFARFPQPLRLVEITQQLGISPSSANQLLKTMMDCAYLLFDPTSKRYYPSPRLASFGGWLASNYFGDDVLSELLRAVQEVTGEVVTLSTRQDSSMQIIDISQPTRSTRAGDNPGRPWQISKGQTSPLFGTANGVAWLSSQNEQSILDAMRHCRRELGHLQAELSPLIMASIEKVRKQGYAFGGASPDDSAYAVAASLPPTPSGIILVLAVFGPAERIAAKRDLIAGHLREEVVRRLGASQN